MDVTRVLPNSILAKIFAHSDPVTLDSCLQANKDWQSIMKIDGYFGDYDKRLWSCQTRETPPFKALANIGDHHVTQAWISQSKRGAGIPQQQLQWKDPHMLKTLWLDGYVSPSTFNYLTLSTDNLHQLIIHSTVFNGIDTDNFNFENRFPNLEIFSMKFRAVNSYPVNSVASCASKQIKLLKNGLTKFPKLKDFTFEAIYVHTGEKFVTEYQDAIYSFITRHAHTLKNLSILLNVRAFSSSRRHIEGLTEVKELDLSLFELDMVEIVGFSSPGYAKLTQHKNMNSITYLGGKYGIRNYQTTYLHMDFLNPIIQNSNRTLKSLILDLNLNFNQQLDLSIFQECHNLEILGLRIPTYAEIPTQSLLIGSKNLPNSIQKIELINCLMSNNECKGLFRNKPNLKYMHVVSHVDPDAGADFGFTVDDLMEIVNQKLIKEFHIKGSLNGKMLKDELNNTRDPICRAIVSLVVRDGHIDDGEKFNPDTKSYQIWRNELNYVPDFHFPYLGRKQNGHFPFTDDKNNLFTHDILASDIEEDED